MLSWKNDMTAKSIIQKIHKADALHTELNRRVHQEPNINKADYHKRRLKIIDEMIFELHEMRRKTEYDCHHTV